MVTDRLGQSTEGVKKQWKHASTGSGAYVERQRHCFWPTARTSMRRTTSVEPEDDLRERGGAGAGGDRRVGEDRVAGPGPADHRGAGDVSDRRVGAPVRGGARERGGDSPLDALVFGGRGDGERVRVDGLLLRHVCADCEPERLRGDGDDDLPAAGRDDGGEGTGGGGKQPADGVCERGGCAAGGHA